MPLVLCFSHDQRLLETRVAVLSTKYRVVPVSTLGEIRNLLNRMVFVLVLLCHTLSDEDCKGAHEIVLQRWPSAKILSMTKVDRGCCEESSEPAVRGLDGPSVLLQRMDILLHPLF